MKLTVENVNKILHKDWDPIGCGVPEDEYISYAKVVHNLLNHKCNEFIIGQYLLHIHQTLWKWFLQ